MEGGYQIIDLKNKELSTSGDGTLIPGAFGLINSTKKPILVQNINLDGTECRDFISSARYDDGASAFLLMDLNQQFQIWVYDSDTVYYYNIVETPIHFSSTGGLELKINDTLEVDAGGYLGVKANA